MSAEPDADDLAAARDDLGDGYSHAAVYEVAARRAAEREREMAREAAEPSAGPARASAEPEGDVGDVDTCPTCSYPLAATVPWHARLPEGVMCALTPPPPEPAP